MLTLLRATKRAAEEVLGVSLADPRHGRSSAAEAPRPRALDRLILAKRESDRGNYPAKHALLRALLRERPADFVVDSEDRGIYGLTHVPSGFRIHMPYRYVPQPHLLRRGAAGPLNYGGPL